MKILAIGGRGQFGQDFVGVARADARADGVIVMGRAEIDLAQVDQVRPALENVDFDVLVNFAAEHRTDEVEANADRGFAVNAHAARELAASCRDHGATFCQVSTDYVFGGDQTRESPYREEDPIAPVNAYGASKAVGEFLARLEHEAVMIVRVASLFGLSPEGPPRGNFIETMLRLAAGGQSLRVVNDQHMSPTATADAAVALTELVLGRAEPGTFHVVNSGTATWHELAAETFRLVGMEADLTPVPSSDYPTPAARPRYCVLDNAKVASIAGPMPDWRDALRRYIEARQVPLAAEA